MGFKIKKKLDFPSVKFSEEYDEGLEKSCHEAATLGEAKASSEFTKHYKGVAPYRHYEKVKNSFKAMKSKYPDRKSPNWLFGVFGSPSGKWEESVGGRAHFFEYGRTAPKGEVKVQPPRPFMRIAKGAIAGKFDAITSDELKKITKKLNRRIK